MSNGRGIYATTPARTMAAFDKLPRPARGALASAAVDWAVQPYLLKWTAGVFASGRAFAARIRIDDRRMTAAQALETWGADHPAAGGAA